MGFAQTTVGRKSCSCALNQSRDGCDLTASFSQPTGVCCEKDSHSIFVVDSSSGRLRLITSVQALTKTRLSCDETVTRVQQCYVFHEASLKVQGIKGSTSQTQGPDGTLSATTLNSEKMILEGLSRLKTKAMELNPNFTQHVDVENLLTLFVENFFSSMRGRNTDTPMMLDFCLHFPRCINELLTRVTGTSYSKSSGLLLPSAYFRKFCDLAGEITKAFV